MRISVYGSAAGNISQDNQEKATEIGRELARRKHILITGACTGLPYDAVVGAKELGGIVEGFSPAVDLAEHKERFNFPTDGFDKIHFIPKDFPYHAQKGACLKLRNVYSVASSDACIIVSGRMGTRNEFIIAYDLGKVIGILEGTGGFADEARDLVERVGKKSDAILVYSQIPKELVDLIEAAEKSRHGSL